MPSSFILLLIINISNLLKISALIVLPFNIKIQNEQNDEFFSKYISTKFEIGEPPQSIEADINFQESDFQLSYTRKYMPYSYNKSQSRTYINTTLYRITTKNFLSGCKANETFYFYKEEELKNKQKYENIPFFMPTNADKLFNAILGFDLSSMGMRGFVASLKNAKAINSYTWTLKFNSLENGLLIIGNEPHIYDHSYDESKLKYTKIYISKNLYAWSCTFSSIKIGEIVDKNHLIAIFRPDIKGLIAPEDYFENLNKTFLNKYINDKICQKIEIYEKNISNNDYYDNQKMKFYKIECDKNKFNANDANRFPSLQFINIPLNYSFIFKGNELFKEEKDKFIFQIYIGDIDYWYFGRIFLLKYQMIFNEDSKLIGFYSGMKEIGNNKSNIILKIILVLLFFLFFIILVIVLFMKISQLNKNKKYANELDDDISYKKTYSITNENINENILFDKND